MQYLLGCEVEGRIRRTTANRLLKAITDNLVSVTSAVVNHDEGMKEPISDEKFKEDLESYVNSGIFADTIDFSVVIKTIKENKYMTRCFMWSDLLPLLLIFHE